MQANDVSLGVLDQRDLARISDVGNRLPDAASDFDVAVDRTAQVLAGVQVDDDAVGRDDSLSSGFVVNRRARLVAIVEFMRGRRSGVTAERLSERFGVTVRTIYRDLDTLREGTLPVKADRGRGGGYALDRHYTPANRQLHRSRGGGAADDWPVGAGTSAHPDPGDLRYGRRRRGESSSTTCCSGMPGIWNAS